MSHQPEQSFALKGRPGDTFQCPLGVMCDTGDVLPGTSPHTEREDLFIYIKEPKCSLILL